MKSFLHFNRIQKIYFGLSAILLLAILISPSLVRSAAGVPMLVNFQGRLMDNTGELLGAPSGTDYCFKFSIYDATTGGSKIWPTGSPTPDTLVVRSGVFDATIGEADTLDLAFTDDQAFVDVAVSAKSGTCDVGETGESYETLSPRPQIVSSGFAINSKTVGGFTPAQSATNNQIPVLTSGAIILGHATTAGITSSGANPLAVDAGASGILNINGTSTGNILLGGGSASTGCTLTNATGAFACTAAITGSNLSGTNTGDQVWNTIGAPTGTQSLTFDDGELNSWTVSSDTETFHTITANSLTTGRVLSASSSSLSSGTLVDLAVTGTAAASNTQKVLQVATSGANGTSTQTTYGGYFSNTHTGVAVTNVAGYFSASGGNGNYDGQIYAGHFFANATSENQVYGIYTEANGTDNNQSYALYAKQNNSNYYSIYSTGGINFFDDRTQVDVQSTTALTVARTGSNYALQVDTNTGSSATGLKITSAAAAGGIALAAISSGTDENITLDAKGAGTVSIGATSTGNILLGGGSASTGCTLTNSTGAFVCTSDISSGGVLQAGSTTPTTYSRLGTATTNRSLNAANDLLISDDLEVEDDSWFEDAINVGGIATFNSDINAVLAGGEDITITNGSYNNTAGVLGITTISSSNFVPSIYNSYTQTATGSITAYAFQNFLSSSEVVAGGGVGQTLYGLQNSVVKTGADTASGTYTIYGNHNTVSNIGRTDTGTVNTYSGYFTATGDTAGTSTAYGIYASATGADNNYALVTNSGNVGIGDTSPASLFTVGSGDLFQINSSGQIGSQQAPVSDYLFALAGTTGNDHSRIIDITQANDSSEDTAGVYISNTVNSGTVTGGTTRNMRNYYGSLTPSVTSTNSSGSATQVNIYGLDQAISLSSTTLRDSANDAASLLTYGTNVSITGTPQIFNADASSATAIHEIYGGRNSITITPSLTAADDVQANYYGSYNSVSVTSSGDTGYTPTIYGLYASASGNLTTTDTTTHYGGYFTASGTADNNYGLYITSSGATTANYGIYVNAGTNYMADDLYIGSLTESISDAGFVLDGNDAYIDDDFGVNGDAYFDGNVTITGTCTGCGGGGLTIGTTAIASGGANRILYENGSTTLSSSANFTYDGTIFTVAGNPTSGAQIALTNTGVYTGTGLFNLTANSATTGTLGLITSSSLTSGSLLSLTSNGTGALTGQKGISVALSGNNASGSQTTYGGHFSNTHGGSGTNVGLYTTASGGTTNLGLNVDAGQTLLGGTTLTSGTLSKLNIVSSMSSDGSTTAIAGIHGDYTFNPSSGGTQVGNRFVVSNAPTSSANTSINTIIRTVDNTSLANTVRGIEIVSSAGSNTSGTNTGLRATGATFGVQAITTGLAGGVSLPAGLYAENTGTTQGDVARFYTGSMTTGTDLAMMTVYHDTSTFTGYGLLMNMATSSGTFSGNFIELRNASTAKFRVTSAGITSVNFNGTATTNGVCHSGADIDTATDTMRDLVACNNAAGDIAEWYETMPGVEAGDVVAVTPELFTYEETQVNPFTGEVLPDKIIRTVSVLDKANNTTLNKVVGIVSTSPYQVIGDDIKDQGQHPRPIALSGRVPVKITSDSMPINAGDYITTSSEAGKATKAIKAGFVIAKALESWAPESGEDTVMVYIEQGYFNGESTSEFAGLDMLEEGEDTANAILAKFLEEQGNAEVENLNVSEILTDRIAAGLEVITPKLVASIVNTSTLNVSNDATFSGLIAFGNTSEDILGKVIFDSEVEFSLPPIFNKDTAGFALVKAGDRSVRVEFEEPYAMTPIVTASMTFEVTDNIDETNAEDLFAENITSIVIEKDETGFTILLNKVAPQNIRFSWIALGVKDAQIFESLGDGLEITTGNSNNGGEESTPEPEEVTTEGGIPPEAVESEAPESTPEIEEDSNPESAPESEPEDEGGEESSQEDTPTETSPETVL